MNRKNFEEHASKLTRIVENCKVFKLYIECFNKTNAQLMEILNEHADKCSKLIQFKIGKDFTTDDFEDLLNYFNNDKMFIFKNKHFKVKISKNKSSINNVL